MKCGQSLQLSAEYGSSELLVIMRGNQFAETPTIDEASVSVLQNVCFMRWTSGLLISSMRSKTFDSELPYQRVELCTNHAESVVVHTIGAPPRYPIFALRAQSIAVPCCIKVATALVPTYCTIVVRNTIPCQRAACGSL